MHAIKGRYQNGQIILSEPADWPENTEVVIEPMHQSPSLGVVTQAIRLTASESELLLQINHGLPAPLAARYRELLGKRRNQILTREELDELLTLTEQVERLEAQRLVALVELARLRQITLPQLMAHLGIQAPAHE